MKILVIEDEENKANHVISLLHDAVKNDINWSRSYMGALIQLKRNQYDIVILDMSLPLNDNNHMQEDFNTFAGLEILDELKRKRRKESVIVFTAFDILGEKEKRISLSELDEKMQIQYPSNYIGCVHYNALSLKWQDEILNKIKEG